MAATAAGRGDAPSLHIHDATLAWNGRPLFAGLSAAFAAARTACLLGPSGVGKTTLLRLLAGLDPPGATARVRSGDGRPLAGRVAWMAQTDLLLPWLSVRDNVLLGWRLRGEASALRAAGARADALLADVGLADRAADPPSTLSGGQRQRVALARTLAEDRPVVLMDEPFAHLDAVTRHELQTLAAGLLQGRTVVLVTHDPLEALRLGHSIQVMAGRPATLGPSLAPPGDVPRPADDPGIARRHGALLNELVVAHAASGEAAS
jgi:putative hydroxymethylpyrimidine transport system ATP-binding protein